MLVEFSVENYKSFGERQTLSMVAPTRNHKRGHKTGNSAAPEVLSAVSIFGSNGSGKTKLIEAMRFFRHCVVNSAKWQKDEEIKGVVPFKLNNDLVQQPSEFRIVFEHSEALYDYEISVDKKRFNKETLSMRLNKKNARFIDIFSREYDYIKGEYKWSINDNRVKGEKASWRNNTKENSLFLSEANRSNTDSQHLSKPFEWLQKYLRIIDSAQRLEPVFTIKKLQEIGWKDKVFGFLKQMDTRIDDFAVVEEARPWQSLPEELKSRLPREALNDENKITFFEVKTLHTNDKGNQIEFDFNEESDGFRVLFSLSAPIYDVLENGYTFVVDELHNSLHPYALRLLLSLFYNKKTNPKGAQLIFSSHETSIMDRGVLHRDQIYFIFRDAEKQSILQPLSDYKLRKDYDNFQKMYLAGRFGALPDIE